MSTKYLIKSSFANILKGGSILPACFIPGIGIGLGIGMAVLGSIIDAKNCEVDYLFFDKAIRPNFELLTFYNFGSNLAPKYLIKDEIIKKLPKENKTLEGFLDD
jgi:hypothetical protein